MAPSFAIAGAKIDIFLELPTSFDFFSLNN
jgi:hypothetical protein